MSLHPLRQQRSNEAVAFALGDPAVNEHAEYAVLVRYGEWARFGDMRTRDGALAPGDAVIVRTARGREWGEVAAPPEPLPAEAAMGAHAEGAAAPGEPAGPDEFAAPEELVGPDAASPVDVNGSMLEGRVLRRASPADRARRAHLVDEVLPRAYERVERVIAEQAAPLRLIAIERLFGAERAVVFVEADAAHTGSLIDDRIAWSRFVEAIAPAFADTRLEVREVGEELRPRLPGCGKGGGCESCASRKAEEAAAEAAPGRAPTPLPMAR